jgi:predicted deacylase
MLHILSDWAQSSNGQPISLHSSLPLTHLKACAPLICIGGVHGDEPEGVFLATALLEWLKSHNGKNRHEWAIIPCLNVDGFKLNQRTNGRGVDLNRNFPSTDWTTEHKAPRYCPGSSGGSENEIKALTQLVHDLQPRLIIHFHSWVPAVIFAGKLPHPAPHFLAESSGYPLKEDIGYPTPGSLGQWAWLDLGIPVICTEEREGATQHETWTRFGPGLQKIFEHPLPLPVK